MSVATAKTKPRPRKTVALAGAYLVLATVLLSPLSLRPASRMADDGDALQGAWILWWSSTHLGSAPSTLFGGNLYYPHPSALVYSEPLLGQALFAWPLFRLLENRVLIVNLVTVASVGLSAFAAHLLLRELTGSHSAAAVGALFYAFNGYTLSNLPRLQLVSLQWMPAALLALHRFFDTGRRRHAWLWAVFTILNGLACLYYGAFYAIVLVFLLPAYMTASDEWRKRGPILALGAAAAASAAVMGAVTLPYARVFRRYGFSGETEQVDLLGYLVPSAHSFLYRALVSPPPDRFGPDRFLGYVALALGAAGLLAIVRGAFPDRWKRVRLGYAALGLAAFLISGGPELVIGGTRIAPGVIELLRGLPLFGNLRATSRFAMLVNLVLSVMVAHGVARGWRSLPQRRRELAVVLLATALVAEHWSPLYVNGTEIPVGDGVPDAYRWLAARPAGEPVAELPPQPFRFTRFASMEAYFATFHRQPTLWGKPSFYPPALELLQWDLRDFPDSLSIHLLQALGVRWALVHPKRWEKHPRFGMRRLADRRDLLPLVQTFPDRNDSLWDRYQLGGEELLAISPLAEAGEPRSCDCRELDRGTLRVSASGTIAPALALDVRTDTKWTTRDGQSAGDFFEITFDRLRVPARIEIEMAAPYGEFARNLEIIGFAGAESRPLRQRADVWYEVALVRQLVRDPKRARLRYDLEPATVDRLRLQIASTEEGTIAWSIPEIHVYEEGPTPLSGRSGSQTPPTSAGPRP
jgi:hypothetical protein